MNKLIIVLLMAVLSLALFAESAKDEAIQSLDTAKSLINKDDLVKARDEINFALAKIGEIQAEQLLTFIPDAPSGYTLGDKESQAIGDAGSIIGSANSIIATADYANDESTLNLNITVGGVLGQAGGLMGLASMFGGISATSGGKTVRISGYSGNQEYDKEEQSGTLTINVGDKITVVIEGDGIANADILKTLAEKIDLAKLEKSF